MIAENAKEMDFINGVRTPTEKAIVLLVDAFAEGRESRGMKISPNVASFAKKSNKVPVPNVTERVKGKKTNDFIFEKAPYHSKTGNAVKSANPAFGQDVLNESIQVKSTSTRRIGVDKSTGEYVVFDQTKDNIYHGHVRKWDELTTDMKNALKKADLVNDKGKIK